MDENNWIHIRNVSFLIVLTSRNLSFIRAISCFSRVQAITKTRALRTKTKSLFKSNERNKQILIFEISFSQFRHQFKAQRSEFRVYFYIEKKTHEWMRNVEKTTSFRCSRSAAAVLRTDHKTRKENVIAKQRGRRKQRRRKWALRIKQFPICDHENRPKNNSEPNERKKKEFESGKKSSRNLNRDLILEVSFLASLTHLDLAARERSIYLSMRCRRSSGSSAKWWNANQLNRQRIRGFVSSEFDTLFPDPVSAQIHLRNEMAEQRNNRLHDQTHS